MLTQTISKIWGCYGQLYFFIWDEGINPLAEFYRAGLVFTFEKDAKYLGGVAFVRV